MKKALVLILSAFCLMAATVLHVQTPVNVTGTWNIIAESPMGNGTPVIELKHISDTTFIGTYRGQLGETDVKGTIKGNKIYFSFDASGNQIEYDGVVDGDTMKGKLKLGNMGEGTFTGTRKK
jgi:hypothetical protein